MPDRTKPPIIHDIQSVRLPEVEVRELDNGIPLYTINLGTQEVLKLEVAFRAGRPYERTRLAARATASQIREGSAAYTSAQVAESMDYYGATLSIPFQLDTSNFILYSLNKHFPKVLGILQSLLQEPLFPDKELQQFIKRNQRRLAVDLSRNDVVAYRELTAAIFGESHPYGYNSLPQTYGQLQRETLQEHYQRLYCAQNCVLFLSGRVTEEVIKRVNEAFCEALPPGLQAEASPQPKNYHPESRFYERPSSVQSAIRIGRRLFNRQHPDYQGFYVLNTLLGGYFSSRLMANVREDKGYTYNIYSSADAMAYDGYFYIGTEVSQEFVTDTRQQIYTEIERLQQEPVGKEELSMVRNYLLGNFLTMLDGPFNISEVIRTQVLEGLPMNYLEELSQTVKQISPDEIQSLAQRYLQRESLWEVIVGA